MRMSRILSCASGYSTGILVFSIGLIVFGASSSFLQIRFSNTTQEFQIPTRVPKKGPEYPPIFSYWISGTKGDKDRILRLLKAVYHPRNQYLLNLDASSSYFERRRLALSVESEKIFQAFGNVNVVGRSQAVDQIGSSALAAMLHAAALLLQINRDWDWFITLSASDYPLISQDDLLHAFNSLPRDMNFIDYTNKTGWKERQRINQIVIDPSLYFQENTPIFHASETRETPDAFRIFGGSPWSILSRAFMEYCVHGWDNLPRKLLMYFSNVEYPLESYFHTVLCNSDEFQNTTLNNDLRFILSDTSPHVEPHFLNTSYYERMVRSKAAFARPFQDDDPVLQKVDEDILRRRSDGLVLGSWCLDIGMNQSVKANIGNLTSKEDSCSGWDNIDAINPGPDGVKLKAFVSKLAAERRLQSNPCNQQ
ncbi:PREDICTED: beta-glucuronosyltransferase GlcAT14A-like isoform X2 [Nelumbo nucifera]|uniref:Beta-glucuronosyltransferase GlcAT14A-like isoform X2 n=1 Tax=Nelumbo nucifera TaxID=4432 RepID=A0A1U8Q914_NELNU|nr:PREDICTED: beta-glucuronosyltransferase GlcAT14A-like isoform X2 [Nelumbo nucifera]